MAGRTAKRHCSVCGRTGHDKRRHERPKCRNVDLFVDAAGQVHPIRSSIGYVEWMSSREGRQTHRSAMRAKLNARRKKLQKRLL